MYGLLRTDYVHRARGPGQPGSGVEIHSYYLLALVARPGGGTVSLLRFLSAGNVIDH